MPSSLLLFHFLLLVLLPLYPLFPIVLVLSRACPLPRRL